MHRRVGAAALSAVAAIAAGCRHLPVIRDVSDCPGVLVSTAEMGADFLWHGRVRVAVEDRSWAFQLVAQKRGEELLLVGIHPLGVKLFTILQQGDEIQVDARPAPVLEVPPENLLRDLHRIRFPEARALDAAEVVFAAARSGEGARAVVRNPRCGVRSEFVTLSGEGPP
jgi:hypothetical protein